jgi:phosphoglucosamine mutase
MTNLGLEQAAARMGIPFTRAAVGDRYVLEKLLQNGWELGGENSGHIICLDKHTTGDGIVSALQVLWALRESRETLTEACAQMSLYPQVLVNVRMAQRFDFNQSPRVQDSVRDVQRTLGTRGRVLLRASGTEPVIRVMVEGELGEEVSRLAQSLASTIRDEAARA